MLRCPDMPPERRRFARWNRRATMVVLALAITLLAVAQLSPVGTLFGLLASLLIMMLGMATGWIVTIVFKIPRDGRGVHEKSSTERDEPTDRHHTGPGADRQLNG